MILECLLWILWVLHIALSPLMKWVLLHLNPQLGFTISQAVHSSLLCWVCSHLQANIWGNTEGIHILKEDVEAMMSLFKEVKVLSLEVLTDTMAWSTESCKLLTEVQFIEKHQMSVHLFFPLLRTLLLLWGELFQPMRLRWCFQCQEMWKQYFRPSLCSPRSPQCCQ